jgi:hypothetical protein
LRTKKLAHEMLTDEARTSNRERQRKTKTGALWLRRKNKLWQTKIRAVARHEINDDKRAEDWVRTEIENLNQSLIA